MAMTFKEKVDLIGKYKDKNDKFASVYKYGKNIDSPKLNDEQKEKVRKNVEIAYNAIKQMQDKKPTKTATAKGGAKKKTMLGLASEIKKRDNVSWDEAKKRAKRDYESDKKKAVNEEKQQLAEFKKQVGKIKFTRATTKTDIKKDKVIPALPSGKRYPKRGTTTNLYGTFKNNPKRPYWENRANRMDINQPSKSVYPKLADGGSLKSNSYKKIGTLDENDYDSWSSDKKNKMYYVVVQVRTKNGRGLGDDFKRTTAIVEADSNSHALKIGKMLFKEEHPNTSLVGSNHGLSKLSKFIQDALDISILDADGQINQEFYRRAKNQNIPQSEIDKFVKRFQTDDSLKKTIKEDLIIRSMRYAKGGEIDLGQMVDGGKMAKGGVFQHGLQEGDKIVMQVLNKYLIVASKGSVYSVVDIEKGYRFIVGLDDSKTSGKRKSVKAGVKEAMDYIDYLESTKMSNRGKFAMSNRGKFAQGGKLSSKAKYIPNRNIDEIEVTRNGKTTSIDGANLLDGVYVKKSKFDKGGTITTLTKSRLKAELYEPRGNFFIEDKGEKWLLHFTPKDASRNFENLRDMGAKDAGKGYHGSAYEVQKKIENKFAEGGEIDSDVMDLKKGDIFKVVQDKHLAKGKTYQFIEFEDKYGTIALKCTTNNASGRVQYVTGIENDGIKILKRAGTTSNWKFEIITTSNSGSKGEPIYVDTLEEVEDFVLKNNDYKSVLVTDTSTKKGAVFTQENKNTSWLKDSIARWRSNRIFNEAIRKAYPNQSEIPMSGGFAERDEEEVDSVYAKGGTTKRIKRMGC